MLRLYSDWAHVEQELGCSLRDRFLMPVRTLDNPKSFAPLILKRGGRRWGLFQGIEIGNVKAAGLPPDIAPVYMRPYFTFETIESDRRMPRNLAEAVESVADGARDVTVDAELPAALAAQLGARFRVSVETGPGVQEVEVARVPRDRVAARLGRDRREAGAAVLALLERSPAREELRPHLEAPPGAHFAPLDDILAEAGLAGVVVSSRINVQEVAGVPLARRPRPLAAIYAAGGDSAFIVERAGRGEGKRYPTARDALRDLLPAGTVGVEAEDLGIGLFGAFGLGERDQASADLVLRRWRDENAAGDLAYYIVAARTSAFASEAALAFAAAEIEAGRTVSEMDVDRVYFRALHEYVRSTGLPLRVTRCMTNLHSGARTPYAANPACHPVGPAAKTLKIDAGCLIFDEEGYVLGNSDIARTLCFTEEGREAYPLIVEGVRRTLIPAARAGATGEEMFMQGVDAVWDRRGELSSKLLAPDLPAPLADLYDRDVGHLLGKNDLAHLRFMKGHTRALKEGMVACCEYQWPVAGHALAYEDACLVTARGGLNFTSDAE